MLVVLRFNYADTFGPASLGSKLTILFGTALRPSASIGMALLMLSTVERGRQSKGVLARLANALGLIVFMAYLMHAFVLGALLTLVKTYSSSDEAIFASIFVAFLLNWVVAYLLHHHVEVAVNSGIRKFFKHRLKVNL